MKILEFEVPLEFIDERNYVHSTTMSLVVWENIAKEVYSDSTVLLDARFHRETSCACRVEAYDDAVKFSPNCAPVAEIKLASKTGQMTYVYFFELVEKPVEKRVHSSTHIENMNSKNRFSGSCNISAKDTISLVSNIVEANKKIHLAAFPGEQELKVVNLYMKKFPIGMQVDKDILPILEIENIGARAHGGGIATLNKLQFPELPYEPFEIAFLVLGSGALV